MYASFFLLPVEARFVPGIVPVPVNIPARLFLTGAPVSLFILCVRAVPLLRGRASVTEQIVIATFEVALTFGSHSVNPNRLICVLNEVKSCAMLVISVSP
jgi:hypothetical protein